MKITLLVVFALLPVLVFGAGKDRSITENWRCQDVLHKGEVVRLKRAGDGGSVTVAGITHRARFQVQGINRRWDFGDDLQYAVVIEPSKRGMYYDFSREATVKPSQWFECRGP